MYEYNAVITNVVDGDTIDAQVDLGFNVFTKQRIRLGRINCPPRRIAEGKVAAEFVGEFLNHKIKLISTRKCKYGRYVGEIFVEFEGNEVNLNDLLLEKGLAVPY